MRLQDCQTIYFACTGNTCRSPLAERILKEHLAKQGIDSLLVRSRRASIKGSELVLMDDDWKDSSRALTMYSTPKGLSKGAEAVILAKYGDTAFVINHRARSFTKEELEEADIVITMDTMHKASLLAHLQAYRQDKRAKVYTLGELVGQQELAIEDPFGKDDVFIERREREELQARLGHHFYIGAFLDTAQEEEHKTSLDPAEEQRLRGEAYLPTFTQLDALIAQLVQLQELPQPLLLEDVFKQHLQQRYKSWIQERIQERTVLRRIEKTVRTFVQGKESTPFSLYENGSYREAIELMKTETAEVVGMLEAMERTLNTVAHVAQNSASKQGAQFYHTILHEKIIPALCMRACYLTPAWTIDRVALGKELEDVLLEITRTIPERMKRTATRDNAFAIKELSNHILTLAQAVCSEPVLNKIYQTMLGVSLHLRSQNEVNKSYHTLAETSVTWFGRDTPAYRFTNEPLADILQATLNLDGPVLCVTASGDALCLLAGNGAKQIAAVDVSRIANVWAEYKFQAFLALSYDHFQTKFAQGDATWKIFPFELPVSEDAHRIFAGYRKSSKRLLETTNIFMSQGYAASNPALVGYLQSEEQYKELQKRAQNTKVRFFPTDITTFFEHEYIPEGYFTTMYLSNILDHTTKEGAKVGKQDFDLGKERMMQVLQPLLHHLAPDGTIVLNLQWCNRAYKGIEEAVKELHFTIKHLPNTTHNGCGSMYILKREM